VEADPHPQWLVELRVVELRQVALHVDGAFEPAARAGVGDHEAALRLDLVAAVLADAVADHRVVGSECLEPAAIAEPLVERGRVLDVGEQDRHRPVGGGGAGQVGLLLLDPREHAIDHALAPEPADQPRIRGLRRSRLPTRGSTTIATPIIASQPSPARTVSSTSIASS
jgi:hypothetical protein